MRYKGRYVEIKTGPRTGQFRKATEHEIEKAKETFYHLKDLIDQIKKLSKKVQRVSRACPCNVFYDERWYTYNTRTCSGCGKILGLI